jgi:hypothetical protein
MILSGTVGVALGIGGTIVTQHIVKKRKSNTNTEAEVVE